MEDVAAARAQDRRLYSKTGGKAGQYNEKRKISLTIPFDATDRMNDPNGFCYFAGAYHVFFSIRRMMRSEERNTGDITAQRI